MITLKKLKPSNIGYFFHLANDPENRKYMKSERQYTQDDFIRLIDNRMIQWYTIHDPKLEGEDKRVGLFTSYGQNDKLYIGIIIHPDHRRKGYARRTFKYYLTATDDLKIPVYLECFKDQPALTMYKELGFKEKKEDRTKVRGKMWITMKREFKPKIYKA